MTVKILCAIFDLRTSKCSVFALALLGSSLLFALFSCSPTRATTVQDGFDQPLKKQVKTLGPPYYPNGRYQKTLSCFFYPTVLVKQYDEGQKGAEWLAFVHRENGPTQKCDLSHEPGERVIDGAEWSGYFKGVKGNLVFFDAADGMDLGIFFAVYDAKTGKKLFEDSAYDSRIENRKVSPSPFNHLRIYAEAGGQVTLRYLRVETTECDLHSEPGSCWEAVRAQFDLKIAKAPVCTGYSNIKDRYASSIAYPVETSLFPQPVTKTIPGRVRCRPVD